MFRSLTGLFLLLTTAAYGKEFRAERFDVTLKIQPDSSVVVTETIAMRFESGSFTYVFRDLALVETDGISNVQASMDGAVLPAGKDPGQASISHGRREIKVRWNFAPVQDSTHLFGLTYTVSGMIRQENGMDVIRWRAVPGQHDYVIDAGSVTVDSGLATPVSRPTLVNHSMASSSREGQPVRIDFGGVARNHSVIVEARYQAGTAARVMPLWQSRMLERERSRPEALRNAAIAFLLVGGIVFLLLGRKESIPWAGMAQPGPVTTPPADLPPAVAGALSGTQGSQRLWGTLVDLARRGIVTFESEPGRWTGTQHWIVLGNSKVRLEPYEEVVLAAIFRPRDGGRVKMSDAGYRLSSAAGRFGRELRERMIAQGYYDAGQLQLRSRRAIRGVWLLLSGLALLVGGIVISAQADLPTGSAIGGAGAGLMLMALVEFVRSASTVITTPAGEEARARWVAFRRWMKEQAKGQGTGPAADRFEPWLPYAAAFGLGAVWAKHFERRGIAATPDWYSGAGDEADFVTLLSHGDSGVASGGGADGGGASGGGASGAG